MTEGAAAWFPEKRCTVLLVDDVCDSREMYAFFLRAAGVVLSAHTFPADEKRAREAGAAAFLAKPCPPDLLARTVRQVSEGCDRAFAVSALPSQLPVISTAPQTGPTPAP